MQFCTILVNFRSTHQFGAVFQGECFQADPQVGILVLGAGTDKSGPGPLVTQMSRNSGTLPIPITIVPGDMSKERLEAIT